MPRIIKNIIFNRPFFVLFMIAFGFVTIADVLYMIFTSNVSPLIVVVAGSVAYIAVALVISTVLKALGLWDLEEIADEESSNDGRFS